MWLESRDGGEMVGHLDGEAGGSQIMWGLAGLLKTLDYKLCEMRTPSGDVRAGELHIIYVLRSKTTI